MRLLEKLTLFVILLFISVSANDECINLFNANEYKKAGDCYIKQLKKHQTANNYFFAGKSLERAGKYNDALSYLKQAEAMAVDNGELVCVYNYLSLVYAHLDKKLELIYDMKTLDLALISEHQRDIGTAYSNIGRYYNSLADDNQALEFYTKALDYLDEKERAIIYQNIANSYENLKDNIKAEEYYKKAIDIEIDSENYLTLCTTKIHVGHFYESQDKKVEALQIFDEAKDICHKAGNIHFEMSALTSAALLYYNTKGDKATANEYINRAGLLFKQSLDLRTLLDVTYSDRVVTDRFTK